MPTTILGNYGAPCACGALLVAGAMLRAVWQLTGGVECVCSALGVCGAAAVSAVCAFSWKLSRW